MDHEALPRRRPPLHPRVRLIVLKIALGVFLGAAAFAAVWTLLDVLGARASARVYPRLGRAAQGLTEPPARITRTVGLDSNA